MSSHCQNQQIDILSQIQALEKGSTKEINYVRNYAQAQALKKKQEEEEAETEEQKNGDSSSTVGSSRNSGDRASVDAEFNEAKNAESFKKHKENKIKCFQSFDHKSYRFLSLEENDWEDVVSPFLSQILPKSTENFDQQMKLAYNMTTGLFGVEEVNTKYFREAIRYYVLQIYGIKSEDFDYSSINENFKNVNFKIYMKHCAGSP